MSRIAFLKHLFLDRRPFCGRSEFSFGLRPSSWKVRKIHVKDREGSFQTTVTLRHGSADVWVFSQVFLNNEYNLRRFVRWDEISTFYSQICAENKTPIILDLGANIGLASLYFTKNWPKARIIAVEPSEENYHVLCRNVTGHSNVQPIMAAIASEDGAVEIANPNAYADAYRTVLASAQSTNIVPALSVQSLLQTVPKDQDYFPYIAKIDIEGFEKDLFSKNTDWVALFPLIIIELHDWLMPRQGSSKSFLRTIAQYDRDFLFVGENVVSIANDLSVGRYV